MIGGFVATLRASVAPGGGEVPPVVYAHVGQDPALACRFRKICSDGEDGAGEVMSVDEVEAALCGMIGRVERGGKWVLITFDARMSLVDATDLTQLCGQRVPPQRPERLRTVVGTAGARERNSCSESERSVGVNGEWRSRKGVSALAGLRRGG